MQLSRLIVYAKFFLALPRFFSRTTSLKEAQSIIKNRMEHRQDNFLEVLKRCVFDYPKSPYLKLFKLANYSYEDVKSLVGKLGLEKTLEILRDAGIYFSIEEFKGRRPVVRKGMEFKLTLQDFRNPLFTRKTAMPNFIDDELRVHSVTDLGTEYLKDIVVPHHVCWIGEYERLNFEMSSCFWYRAV